MNRSCEEGGVRRLCEEMPRRWMHWTVYTRKPSTHMSTIDLANLATGNSHSATSLISSTAP